MKDRIKSVFGLGVVLALLLGVALLCSNGIANEAGCFTVQDGNAVMDEIGSRQLYATASKTVIGVLTDILNIEVKGVDEVSVYLAPNGQQVGIVLYAKGCAVKSDGTPAADKNDVELYVFPLQIWNQVAEVLRSVDHRSKV